MARGNISSLFADQMDCHSENTCIVLCHRLKDAEISLQDTIVMDEVTQIKVASTSISSDAEFASPVLPFTRQLECDNLIFVWKVQECIILRYYLSKRDRMLALLIISR